MCTELGIGHGTVTYNPPRMTGPYPYGTVATIQCNNGYLLKGSMSSTCGSSGTPTWDNFPQCWKGNEDGQHLLCISTLIFN